MYKLYKILTYPAGPAHCAAHAYVHVYMYMDPSSRVNGSGSCGPNACLQARIYNYICKFMYMHVRTCTYWRLF